MKFKMPKGGCEDTDFIKPLLSIHFLNVKKGNVTWDCKVLFNKEKVLKSSHAPQGKPPVGGGGEHQ